MTDQFRATPLLDSHYTNYFSCGHNDDLDRWLDRRALADQHLGKSATHVWVDGSGCVVAYFTLLQTTIRESEDDSFFSRIRPKGFPRDRELPGVLIGKLALDRSLQNQGLGMDLIADAYFTASEAVIESSASPTLTAVNGWCSTSVNSTTAPVETDEVFIFRLW